MAGSRDVGGFDRMRADLQRLAPASRAVARRLAEPSNRGRPRPGPAVSTTCGWRQPSSRFQRFEQRNGLFTIDHPDNWRAYAVRLRIRRFVGTRRGVVDVGNGQQAMLYGVIVNHYAPFEGDTDRRQESQQRSYAPFEDTDQWRGSLADATDDLVRQIIRSNSYLRAQDGQARREQIDGRRPARWRSPAARPSRDRTRGSRS